MRKFIFAALALSIATPASAQDLMIGAGRRAVITEAAKSICRSIMESEGKAGDNFDREVAYLNLTQDENLYMLSLCVLYAQGRVDEIRRK